MQYGRRRRTDRKQEGVPEGIHPESFDANLETQNMLAEYLTAMGQGSAQVRMVPQSSSMLQYQSGANIRKFSNNRQGTVWQAQVPEGAHYTDVMRLAAQQLFALNDGLVEMVTRKLSNPNVAAVANAIEAARLEWLGDRWFKSNLAEGTKHKIHKSYLMHDDLRVPRPYHGSLSDAIRKELYQLPGKINDKKINAAMDKFGDEVRAAAKTLDQAAALNVAVHIAEFMDWYEIPPEDGEDEPGDDEGEGGYGRGSGTGKDGEGAGGYGRASNDSGDGEGQGEGGGDGDAKGKQSGSVQGSSPIQSGPGGRGGGQPSVTDGQAVSNPTPPPKVTESEMRANAEAISKRVISNMKRTKTRRANKEADKQRARSQSVNTQQAHSGYNYSGHGNAGDAEFDREHTAEVLVIPGTPIQVSDHTQLAIQQYLGSRAMDAQLLRRGSLARNHAWKLNQGSLRVFQRPPKTRGQVSILVDMSGSMGCWCPICQENETAYTSGAFLAWQVVGALSQLHPTAEIYGFTSIRSNRRATIMPLTAGNQPGVCGGKGIPDVVSHLMGGTPTCTAMLWFKEHLSSRPADTTAIIVTDGGPDPCGNGRVSHVEAIGRQMLDSGVKFGTVFIGNGQYINMPTEVSVNISSIHDLVNIQPLLAVLDK